MRFIVLVRHKFLNSTLKGSFMTLQKSQDNDKPKMNYKAKQITDLFKQSFKDIARCSVPLWGVAPPPLPGGRPGAAVCVGDMQCQGLDIDPGNSNKTS